MGEEAGEKPLQKMAEAFRVLATAVKNCKEQNESEGLDSSCFSHACSHVSVLFGCLGVAFKFAENDFVAKVQSLFFFLTVERDSFLPP